VRLGLAARVISRQRASQFLGPEDGICAVALRAICTGKSVALGAEFRVVSVSGSEIFAVFLSAAILHVASVAFADSAILALASDNADIFRQAADEVRNLCDGQKTVRVEPPDAF
jgi:hypothetical protein